VKKNKFELSPPIDDKNPPLFVAPIDLMTGDKIIFDLEEKKILKIIRDGKDIWKSE